MLQRIQSAWLLFAAVCAFATLKFPVYSVVRANESSLHSLNGTENLYIMSATLAAGIIALINIFLYQNRKLQLRLTILCIILECLLMFLYYREIHSYIGPGNFALSSLLHIAVLFLLILAARGINNDEKLIKDSNRLR